MDNLVSLIDILYLIIDQFSIIRARHFYLARKLLFCIENLFDNFYSIIFLFFFFYIYAKLTYAENNYYMDYT